MQMLKKIFKSKDKYYLELDEAVETAKKVGSAVQDKAADVLESKPVQQAVETVKEAADVAQDKLQSAVSTDTKTEAKSAAKSAEKKVESVASEAKTEAKSAAKSAANKVESVAGEAKTEAKSAANKVEKTAKGKQATKKDNSASQSKSQPSPQDAGASSFDPPFWVAAMYKNSSTNVNSDGTQAQQTFATDNLMPIITNTRRRPGPSLNKFKDMANKAKTPKG